MVKLRSFLTKEPLLLFLVIGVVVSVIFESSSGELVGSPDREIVISQPQIVQMATQFARRFKRPPTQQEMDGLIDSYVQSEVYYREALAAGLDRDDQVVRRRLGQKLQTLMDDASSSRPPSNQELIEFMRANEERYLVDGGLPDLEDVRPIVESEWLAVRRTEAKAASIAELRQKYEVRIEWPDSLDTGP